MPKKRMLFGVIAASVSEVSQRELLYGIEEEAKKRNIDIAVISNIYNENCGDGDLAFENIIYELAFLPAFDGFIMLSESFSYQKIRDNIQNILTRINLPIIIAGASLTNFYLSGAISINTNNENDMEDIVSHLIDEHGFTDIDILTGFDCVEVSHLRVNGYKKALEKHGIPFDEKKVIYGDFWVDSGKRLAIEYIEGRRPYPQALVCSNDYMAFGLEDEFTSRNIRIENLFTVVGFDFSMDRLNHTPLLTSYRFNRKQLGRDAVNILCKKLSSDSDIGFQPPKGKMVYGLSCPCDLAKINFKEEQEYLRTNIQYEKLLLNSNMDQKITSSHTLDELLEVVGEFQYLIRCVNNIFICLYENWYERRADIQSEHMSCRSIMPWLDTSAFNLNKNCLTDIISSYESPAAYYFSPLVFDKCLFGYVILKYDNSDSYDNTFKNWVTSVANGLELLRLKNDINYLLECQSLNKTHDIMTGLKNDIGIKKSFYESVSRADEKNTYFIMIKCCLFQGNFDDVEKKDKISAILDIANALKQFALIIGGTCGRLNDNTFVCILNTGNMTAENIEDLLVSFITQCKTYLLFYGINSFLYSVLTFEENNSYSDLKQKCMQNITNQINNVFELYKTNHYGLMLEIRTDFFMNPQKEFTTKELCMKYSFSPSYLRIVYKKIFGVSLIQDCINGRIYRAKYLLLATNMKTAEVSKECGYDDPKYFLRQFMNCTGMTPKRYRENYCNL